jgi:hypothetical protein
MFTDRYGTINEAVCSHSEVGRAISHLPQDIGPESGP